MRAYLHVVLTTIAVIFGCANYLFAAWGLPIYDANSSSKTKGHNSITRAIPMYTDSGVVMIVSIAKNNSTKTDGNWSEVTSVTDSQANTYLKAVEFTNSQGSAQAGATVSVWYSVLTGSLDETDSVTATYASGVDASAIKLLSFTVDPGSMVTWEKIAYRADDGTDPGPLELSDLSDQEHLALRVQAHEGPRWDIANWTSTPSFYTTHPAAGSTGSGPASNMTVSAEWDIFTGDSITSDPTWGSTPRDEASVLIIFNEISSAPLN